MKRVVAVALCLAALPLGAARTRTVRHPRPPLVSHVVVVVLENTDAAAAVGQPFLRRLIAEGTLLRNYHALTHPSQPNYIAMTAGSFYGVRGDEPVTLQVTHIGDLLEKSGRDWKAYAEAYPGDCSLVVETKSGYARRHVPFLNYANVQSDRRRCVSHVVNSSALDVDVAANSLPSYALYVPDNRHNGHDTSVEFADQWLEARFGPLLADPRFTNGLLLVVTFDESTSTGGNRIATILWGPAVKRGAVDDHYYDHYSLLRTVEDLFHTGSLGQHDAAASSMAGLVTR